MAGKITAVFVLFAITVFVANLQYAQSNPAIAGSYDSIAVCIENCAQCKHMLGKWFEGPLCAESCIKFKGQLIPECEDFASISPFLTNKF